MNFRKALLPGALVSAFGLVAILGNEDRQKNDYVVTESITPDTGMTRSAVSDVNPYSLPRNWNGRVEFVNKHTGETELYDGRFTTVEPIPEID